MNLDGSLTVDVASVLDTFRERGEVYLGGTPEERRFAFGELSAHLGSTAILVDVPESVDRAEYLLLRLAEDCGTSQQTAEALRAGAHQALETLLAPLSQRALLIEGADHLLSAGDWELESLVTQRLAPVRNGLRRVRRVEGVSPGPEAMRLRFDASVGSRAQSLWLQSGCDVDVFRLALILSELQPASPVFAEGRELHLLAERVHAATPSSLREIVNALCVHGRPFAERWLPRLSIHEEVVDVAVAVGLIHRTRGDLQVVQPLRERWPIAPPVRADLHKRLAGMFAALAAESPLAVVEAHRHYAERGDFNRAAEFAQYSISSMLHAARRASRAHRWEAAIEGYEVALGLSERVEVTPEVRGYARHYLHYNRFRADRELLPATLAGYRRALDDWPGNALFWSRAIRCEFYANNPHAGVRALSDAYDHVQPHPQRDAFLRWRTADGLIKREMWLAALATLGEAAPPSAACRLTRHQLDEAFERGVTVRDLWVPHRSVVSFDRDVELRIRADVAPGIAAVIPGAVGRGRTREEALGDLVAQLAEQTAGQVPVDAAAFAETARERQYQRLGRTKGPDSVRETRAALLAWWVSQGGDGARWLLARVAQEIHWDVLHAVITVLTRGDSDVGGAVLDALEHGAPGEDAALAFLKALAEVSLGGVEDRARRIANRFAAEGNCDAQEVAAEILTALSSKG
ncbi:MAG: hypothetical protein U0324_20475 [Polyangiales bacterium]